MSWRTSGLVLGLRNAGRVTGLNRLLATLRQGEYEDRFQEAMLSAVGPGDVVWDVGANQGLYSRKFSELVGATGKIFAFEPSRRNFSALQKATCDLSNVSLLQVAMGREESTVVIEQGEDALGATSRVVDAIPGNGKHDRVRLTGGDDLIRGGEALLPSIIKIDTEGFELDVLEGLKETLQSPALRVLCIEVHFQRLNERGMDRAPAEIEAMLRRNGFAVAWPDQSHIVATRRP